MINVIKKVSLGTWLGILIPLCGGVLTWLVTTSVGISLNGRDIEKNTEQIQENEQKIENVDQKREDFNTQILKEMREGFERIEDKLENYQRRQ